jgi:hypothetical protein
VICRLLTSISRRQTIGMPNINGAARMSRHEFLHSLRSLALMGAAAVVLSAPALRAVATNGGIDASIMNATCMILGVTSMSVGLSRLKRGLNG